jgi:phosphoglycerol transferase MdoB-like AlkP superfamily enzyme
MTGLPDAELRTNYQATARSPYPTSIAPIFERLGYRTRFFYGGFLSWQRVGDFARDQGFDEVYGGAQMGSWVTSNEWGVDDEDLLRFVRASVPDDVPSFNLIMTTSLHPPYDVDVAAEGFAPRAVPDAIAARLQNVPGSRFPGHYWYANRCIADFVRAGSASLTHALFAVTGDHPSRVEVLTRPTLFDLRAVPLILYGPDVLRDQKLPDGASGSHIDIAPTLIELAAPAGFSYHALGKSLFAADGHPVGIGQRVVIGGEYLLDMRRGGQRHEAIGAATGAPPPELLESWRTLHDALHGVAWWRIKHGQELAEAPSP